MKKYTSILIACLVLNLSGCSTVSTKTELKETVANASVSDIIKTVATEEPSVIVAPI